MYQTFIQLISNSAIISLALGALVGMLSSFEIPQKIASLVAIYLVFAIGFKGGACLGAANACTPPLIMLTCVGIVIGFLLPFFNNQLLKNISTLDRQTRIVLASQYGSISIVTFIAAMSFLNQNHIIYDTFMTAFAGIMEIPGIFSGLFLLRKQKHEAQTSFGASFVQIAKAIILCEKINLIFIGFFVGLYFHDGIFGPIEKLVLFPFDAALILFMIDIGIKIANQRKYIMQFSLPLILFGTLWPALIGCVSVVIGSYVISSAGSLLLFAVLMASASYIAVPAIMHSQAPDAKEAIYMPMALGITLPFNILCGIPLYYYVVKLMMY